MKYLKKFELLFDEPQIGDYVICNDKNDPELEYFISKNIGKIIGFTFGTQGYLIKYENVPDEINHHGYFAYDDKENCRGMYKHEIVEFAPTKEELEMKLSAKKYNI